MSIIYFLFAPLTVFSYSDWIIFYSFTYACDDNRINKGPVWLQTLTLILGMQLSPVTLGRFFACPVTRKAQQFTRPLTTTLRRRWGVTQLTKQWSRYCKIATCWNCQIEAINNTSNSGDREWKHAFDHPDLVQTLTETKWIYKNH